MLMPNKTKYRKQMKGRVPKGTANTASALTYGAYGLKSLDTERVTSRQIEAARQAMTRYVKRGGKIWIRIFPHLAVTKKPQDVKMGSGKGNPEYFAARVKPGTILFEIDDVTEEQAREAMRLAAHKLPVRCKFVMKEGV